MPSSRPGRVSRALASDGATTDLVLADGIGAAELDLAGLGSAPARERGARFGRAAARPTPPPQHGPASVFPVNAWAESPAREGWRAQVKRLVDVVGAVLGLVVAAPVMLLFGLAAVLTSPGPAVFAHMRLGRDGRLFRCYKLRTMCVDAEAHLEQDPALRASYRANGFKLPSDVDRRVTPLGRFMRLTSVDELPQLWNVLCGDMSLVGPRPIVGDELLHYSVRDRRVLLSLRPGITGAWAVGGRNRLSYPARADVELDYVRRWTFRRDLAILGRTVGAVLARRGAI